jgi:hypothetical protein
MKPISGLVVKSTVGELVIRLSNGHEVTTSPQPLLHFGQAVFVGYDRTKNRVGAVYTEFHEENPESMVEPTAVPVILEDVDPVDCRGSVN